MTWIFDVNVFFFFLIENSISFLCSNFCLRLFVVFSLPFFLSNLYPLLSVFGILFVKNKIHLCSTEFNLHLTNIFLVRDLSVLFFF